MQAQTILSRLLRHRPADIGERAVVLGLDRGDQGGVGLDRGDPLVVLAPADAAHRAGAVDAAPAATLATQGQVDDADMAAPEPGHDRRHAVDRAARDVGAGNAGERGSARSL